MTRDEAVKLIKEGLETRSGIEWSVEVAVLADDRYNSWIDITSPAARREPHSPWMTEEDRLMLRKLLRRNDLNSDGCSVSAEEYEEYVARALGRGPSKAKKN
jgi:hypothetical protein